MDFRVVSTDHELSQVGDLSRNVTSCDKTRKASKIFRGSAKSHIYEGPRVFTESPSKRGVLPVLDDMDHQSMLDAEGIQAQGEPTAGAAAAAPRATDEPQAGRPAAVSEESAELYFLIANFLTNASPCSRAAEVLQQELVCLKTRQPSNPRPQDENMLVSLCVIDVCSWFENQTRRHSSAASLIFQTRQC